MLLSLSPSLRAQTDTNPDFRILALDPRWMVSFTSSPAAPAGFDQQMAYVPLKGGELVAVDLDEGSVRWIVPLETVATPATGDGLVFVAGSSAIVALDQDTGQVLWRTPLPQPVAGPVYWDAGWLLASTATGDLLALRAEDGRVVWQQPLESPMAVRPTAFGDRVYVALADRRIAALVLDTGGIAWTVAVPQPVTGLLALNDQLVVGTRGNALHSLSLDRGRVRWTQRAGADVAGAPVADERAIYFAALDNVLRALHRGNGHLKWRRNLPSRPRGGPLLADDVVLVPLVTTDIGAYRADTGAEAFTIRAAGELGGVPFLRDRPRPTAPRLIALSREGALQGFAPRFEPPPQLLTDLPGERVGS